ncbi:hypothetical protein ETB97_003980 [Aspergillus alliaceus]|uniref:Uncharacterized protein n=1 Tax=Petromyces alliaceus TaxID=209559 RepID=A0A8H6E3Z6_PETAA|nr:hypothetical protein ETB97_003980 [Aspergillus burnettii]
MIRISSGVVASSSTGLWVRRSAHSLSARAVVLATFGFSEPPARLATILAIGALRADMRELYGNWFPNYPQLCHYMELRSYPRPRQKHLEGR